VLQVSEECVVLRVDRIDTLLPRSCQLVLTVPELLCELDGRGELRVEVLDRLCPRTDVLRAVEARKGLGYEHRDVVQPRWDFAVLARLETESTNR
jgi:hypothetical protein